MYSQASVNGDAQDDALLKITGSNPVLTTKIKVNISVVYLKYYTYLYSIIEINNES